MLVIIGVLIWFSYAAFAAYATVYGKDKSIGIVAIGIGLTGCILAYFTKHPLAIIIGVSIGSKYLAWQAKKVF